MKKQSRVTMIDLRKGDKAMKEELWEPEHDRRDSSEVDWDALKNITDPVVKEIANEVRKRILEERERLCASAEKDGITMIYRNAEINRIYVGKWLLEELIKALEAMV